MYKRKRTGQGKQNIAKKRKYINYTQQVPYGVRNIKKGVDSHFASGAASPNFNTNAIVSDMSNNAFVFPVNLIQSGTGSWQRVGRLITMKSIRFKGRAEIVWPTASGIVGRKLRMLIVYDKQPNGTLPIKSDIIQYKNQAGTETGFTESLLSYDNMERFTIIRDESIDFNPGYDQTAAGSVKMVCSFDEYAKIGLATNYKAESSPAVIGDISTGALYIVLITDIIAAAATDGNLSVWATSRLRYTDQ